MHLQVVILLILNRIWELTNYLAFKIKVFVSTGIKKKTNVSSSKTRKQAIITLRHERLCSSDVPRQISHGTNKWILNLAKKYTEITFWALWLTLRHIQTDNKTRQGWLGEQRVDCITCQCCESQEKRNKRVPSKIWWRYQKRERFETKQLTKTLLEYQNS